jgi:hypothetical protein
VVYDVGSTTSGYIGDPTFFINFGFSTTPPIVPPTPPVIPGGGTGSVTPVVTYTPSLPGQYVDITNVVNANNNYTIYQAQTSHYYDGNFLYFDAPADVYNYSDTDWTNIFEEVTYYNNNTSTVINQSFAAPLLYTTTVKTGASCYINQ